MDNVVSQDHRGVPAEAPPAPRRAPAPAMIYQLQYLRALAAISVVLCHASYYVRYYRNDPRMWDIFDRAGGFGVVLFFAISGYLMAQLAQSTPGLRFMMHRLIRIYPIYWLCVLIVVSVSLLFSVDLRLDPLALLLVPGGTTAYILGVEWTLPFELTFYIIVFVVILVKSQRHIPLIAGVWIVVIELAGVLRPDLQQGQFPLLLHLPFSQYSLPFAAGLLIPLAVRRHAIGPTTPLLAVGLLAASEALPDVALSFGAMSLGCVLLVATAVGPRRAAGQTPNQSLVLLGDWSYALYLSHVPIITTLCRIVPASVPTIPLWFAAVSVPVMVATVLGRIDLAIYQNLKVLSDRSGALVKGAICGGFLVVILGASGYTYLDWFRLRHASAASSALANDILSAMNTDRTSLAAAAARAGLRPDDMLRGYYDVANRGATGGIFLKGWAADATGRGRAVRVLVFHCGRYLGVLLPVDTRPDVGEALRIGDGHYGFSRYVASPECDNPDVDGLIVTKDGRYAAMTPIPLHR